MADGRRFSPELRDRLVELFGPDGALELMERVPQVPWHEIVTKADLAEMRTEMVTKSDLTRELAVVRAEMADQFRDLSFRMTTTMVSTMLGGIFGAAGLAFAATKLA